MNKPRRLSFFTLGEPREIAGDMVAYLYTREPAVIELVRQFPGVESVFSLENVTRIWFDRNYDYEEVWLLLYDALQEANDRLMADERLSSTFDLDSLDLSGI